MEFAKVIKKLDIKQYFYVNLSVENTNYNSYETRFNENPGNYENSPDIKRVKLIQTNIAKFSNLQNTNLKNFPRPCARFGMLNFFLLLSISSFLSGLVATPACWGLLRIE